MQRHRIDEAIKIYNEMKKRAQFPDGYTYILLLRGLAKGHHHGQVVKESNVAKAVSVYNSMFSPTSRVKPGVHHTNAVLRVCSAALDMDALWGIAARMPSRGAGAPDHMTYTTLLNAIRHGAFGRNPEETALEQVTRMRDKAVQEGRRIWQEVIPKWRGGEIHIDEELVCAMGRLLLISRRMGDWDDVLNLVQQTMKMERLVPPLGHPERHTEHVPQDEEVLEAEPEPEEDSEGYSDTPSTMAFRPIQPLPPDSAYPNRPTSLAWVQPGNATLGMLIDACTNLRTPKTAVAYWALLTGTYDVKPGIINFQAQLKLHSKNRASAKAAALLRDDMVAAGIEPKNQTFRLAMAVCVRDKNNPNVLDHARTVVDVMEKTRPDLDIHTLIQYLNLALATDDGPKIVGVLDRLDPIVHNLRSRITYGTDETGHMTPQEHLTEKEEIVQFFQTIVGVIDTLMNRGLVPRDDYQHWHARRSQLTQFIGRARVGVERLRTKLEFGELEATTKDGRRQRERSETEVVGRPRPQMNKSEWALKTFRWKGRREQARERSRLEGFKGWNDEWKPVKDEKLRNWDGRQAKEVVENPGFADSAMELSGRG